MSGAYFDHNATTPLDPRVREAMLPWLGERWGNPSSIHRFGQAAAAAVEEAREQVARLVGAIPPAVVFCGSGTEANNAVIWSAARRSGFRGHLVLSALEHPSVRAAAAAVAELGCAVTEVPPGRDGVVDAERLLAALRPESVLVALQLANNEVGTLQPVAAVGAACRARGVPLLCDAVQAVGKVAVDCGALGADYLVLAGHKFHGPAGAAALVLRGGAPFLPWLVGGAQERRRRASTTNVAAVVGLGAAAELAQRELPERAARLSALRDRCERGLEEIAGVRFHAREVPRLPNTAHVAFPGLVGQELMIRLDLAGFAVSTGSACASGAVEPSPVLLSMGLAREEALASIRLSFGLPNTEDEVDALLPVLAGAVAALCGGGKGAG
ncbi:MAG TPA: cysteine desulfurase family protein [Thermoanaerobaculia bacterium]|nr:cysteine desulfurase family protein [Thermoanaerobaculia bacterium]